VLSIYSSDPSEPGELSYNTDKPDSWWAREKAAAL
jgi:hypothetical protein